MAKFPKKLTILKENAMVNEIITIFCICDEYLDAINYKDNKQARMSTSEVLTTAIVAAKFFGGNYEKSRKFLSEHHYINAMLSKSRFIRRLNSIDKEILKKIFFLMSEIFKATNVDKEYALDSFPVPVCLNVRIWRSKIYKEPNYKGYSAVKQDYFFGIKVHMLVTKDGKPVEFFITPGSVSDIKAARSLSFNLPKFSNIHADRAYNDYDFEDYLELQRQLNLKPQRKKNSKRKDKGMCSKTRKVIETTFSSITNNFAKKIHAVTAHGFELKIFMFIFAYAMQFL